MLKSLKIKNVALIKEAEIEFGAGLNVLSGETGAGKSVVLDSLNFALGQKADKTMITYGQHDCAVTCVFDISNVLSGLDVLDEIGVDYDDEIIVKRTLNIDGKSTIKLNGESVTATMLRKVTSHLVDIHGQSDHFLLLKESNQLAMLDNLSCKIDNIKEEISQKLALIRDIDSQLDTIGGDEGARERKLDYLRFSIDEINRVNLGKAEEEDLLNRKKMLLNAEKIIVNCSESVEALSGEEGVLDRIGDVSRRIGNISGCSVEYENILSRLEAVLEEVSDITAAINDSFDTDYDPAELDEIEARLAEIGNLKKKYGKTYDEIIGNLDRFQSEYNLLLASDELREKLLLSREKELASLDLIYNRLTAERKAVADNLCADLSNKLKELAMPGAEFLIDFTLDEGEVLSTKGRDNVTFMFTANKGEAVKPLSKVISGGEYLKKVGSVLKEIGYNGDMTIECGYSDFIADMSAGLVPVPDWLLQIVQKKPSSFTFMRPTSITDAFGKLAQKHGLSCSFHGLRHYYASVMESLGIPESYQMERLGHTTNSMLKRYQEYLKEKEAEVNDALMDHLNALNPKKKAATTE